MKRSGLLRPILLSVVGSVVFAIPAFSQCVKCVPAPPGWMCMAGSIGGEGCITDNLSCTLVNPCSCTGSECPDGLKSSSLSKVKIAVPDSIVREVGRIDPQFGIVLVKLRNLPPAQFREGIISIASVDLDFSDVESHLLAGKEAVRYELELKQRISDSFTAGSPASTYSFVITENGAGEGMSLVIIPGDSSTAALRSGIEFGVSTVESVKEGEPNLKVLNWRRR